MDIARKITVMVINPENDIIILFISHPLLVIFIVFFIYASGCAPRGL